MTSPTNCKFCKNNQTNVLWVNICNQDYKRLAVSINKWCRTRYPGKKFRVVSKKRFELVKKISEQKSQ